MRHKRSALGAIFLLSAAATGTAQAGSFTTIIDPADPTFTQALGVNNAGTIVGYGNAAVFNGFQLTLPSSFTRENVQGVGVNGGTQVIGIDGAGNTVGFYVDAAGTNHGFWSPSATGPFNTIDRPSTAFNQLLGINQAGNTAVGYSSTDPTGATLQEAFSLALSTQTYTDINALLPTNLNSQATGVNNGGTVVGFYQQAGGNFSAFTDIGGIITSFEAPGAVSTQALGINDNGVIVGDYVTAGGTTFGFVDVGGSFITLNPPTSTGTTANGINDHNQEPLAKIRGRRDFFVPAGMDFARRRHPLWDIMELKQPDTNQDNEDAGDVAEGNTIHILGPHSRGTSALAGRCDGRPAGSTAPVVGQHTGFAAHRTVLAILAWRRLCRCVRRPQHLAHWVRLLRRGINLEITWFRQSFS